MIEIHEQALEALLDCLPCRALGQAYLGLHEHPDGCGSPQADNEIDALVRYIGKHLAQRAIANADKGLAALRESA